MSLIKAALAAILSFIGYRYAKPGQDQARKDGQTEQQLADANASTASQEKIDEVPYPNMDSDRGPTDADRLLNSGKF